MAEISVIVYPSKDGHIYELVEKGFGDVQFNVKGVVIIGNRQFISIKNDILKAKIETQTVDCPIDIDGVEPNAFKECLRLLGGAEVKINENNCIDLLVASIILEIPKLKENASKYIIKNVNEKIVTQFLKNLETATTVADVEIKVIEFLVHHGYIYFDNYHLFKLSISELYYICQIEDMIIPSEKYMLVRIIDYYNHFIKSKSGEEGEEFTEHIKNIIQCINYGDDCLKELYHIKLYEEKDEKLERVNRVYFNPSSSEDLNKHLIALYNSDKSSFHLSNEMKEGLENIQHLVDFISPIVTDKETNDKTFINCLTILLECHVENPFNSEKDRIDCFTRLLGLYDKVVDNHNLKYSENNVLECFLLFTMKYAEALRDKLGSKELVKILQYYNVLKDNEAVTMVERLKLVCDPNDFQCLGGLLNMDISEDQQFWEYICNCIPIAIQPSQQIHCQYIPSQPIPSQVIPFQIPPQFQVQPGVTGCQYYPSQPINGMTPASVVINPQPNTAEMNLPPTPPN